MSKREPLSEGDDKYVPSQTCFDGTHYKGPIPASLAQLMKMDLEAWRIAKAAIAEAAKPT